MFFLTHLKATNHRTGFFTHLQKPRRHFVHVSHRSLRQKLSTIDRNCLGSLRRVGGLVSDEQKVREEVLHGFALSVHPYIRYLFIHKCEMYHICL